ncbi:MAG TPA: hypothetical protein VMS71_00195 [Candidatus Acidoferrum sp.]|nr:hypothetical protein [Candidatus Acidoferrum sp.]
MADQDKQTGTRPRINDDQRFHYIGFDVFPGKAKPLFKTDAEKAKIVQAVQAKRQQGELIRDECKLLTPRISKLERLVLTVASVVIIVALIFPWYSAYNEVTDQPATGPGQTAGQSQTQVGSSGEEIITGVRTQAKVHREYRYLSGIESLLSIGTVGGQMFSSGFVLILTAIIFFLYPLLCLAIPVYNLVGIYKTRGTPDEIALKLKKQLRLNWIPVLMFAFAFAISFFGADYGFSAPTFFSNLGTSYGPGVFLGSLSWGLLVTLGCFLVLALKAVEI